VSSRRATVLNVSASFPRRRMRSKSRSKRVVKTGTRTSDLEFREQVLRVGAPHQPLATPRFTQDAAGRPVGDAAGQHVPPHLGLFPDGQVLDLADDLGGCHGAKRANCSGAVNRPRVEAVDQRGQTESFDILLGSINGVKPNLLIFCRSSDCEARSHSITWRSTFASLRLRVYLRFRKSDSCLQSVCQPRTVSESDLSIHWPQRTQRAQKNCPDPSNGSRTEARGHGVPDQRSE